MKGLRKSWRRASSSSSSLASVKKWGRQVRADGQQEAAVIICQLSFSFPLYSHFPRSVHFPTPWSKQVTSTISGRTHFWPLMVTSHKDLKNDWHRRILISTNSYLILHIYLIFFFLNTGSPRNSRLIRRRRSSRIAKNRELRNTLISHNFQSEITENYIVNQYSWNFDLNFQVFIQFWG